MLPTLQSYLQFTLKGIQSEDPGEAFYALGKGAEMALR